MRRGRALVSLAQKSFQPTQPPSDKGLSMRKNLMGRGRKRGLLTAALAGGKNKKAGY